MVLIQKLDVKLALKINIHINRDNLKSYIYRPSAHKRQIWMWNRDIGWWYDETAGGCRDVISETNVDRKLLNDIVSRQTVWQFRLTVYWISKTQDPNYGYARYCAVIYNGATTNHVCIKQIHFFSYVIRKEE